MGLTHAAQQSYAITSSASIIGSVKPIACAARTLNFYVLWQLLPYESVTKVFLLRTWMERAIAFDGAVWHACQSPGYTSTVNGNLASAPQRVVVR